MLLIRDLYFLLLVEGPTAFRLQQVDRVLSLFWALWKKEELSRRVREGSPRLNPIKKLLEMEPDNGFNDFWNDFHEKREQLTNVVATIPDIPPSKKFFTLWEVEVVAATVVGTFGICTYADIWVS